jgi:hypothetical protein
MLNPFWEAAAAQWLIERKLKKKILGSLPSPGKRKY